MITASLNYEAFFKITYGLFIISTQYKGKLNGFISNTVFQVTAEPPQFAVCCNKENYSAELIKKSNTLSVSVLKQDIKKELIGLFGYRSGKDVNKFENINYITGASGTPIVIDDTIAWFECSVINTFDVGTHLIFLCKVNNSELIEKDAEPLSYAFYREVKKGLAPKKAPTYIDKSKLSQIKLTEIPQNKFECQVCGYIYDPAKGDEKYGITAGTSFNDLLDNWTCPVCGTRKTDFNKIN